MSHHPGNLDQSHSRRIISSHPILNSNVPFRYACRDLHHTLKDALLNAIDPLSTRGDIFRSAPQSAHRLDGLIHHCPGRVFPLPSLLELSLNIPVSRYSFVELPGYLLIDLPELFSVYLLAIIDRFQRALDEVLYLAFVFRCDVAPTLSCCRAFWRTFFGRDVV